MTVICSVFNSNYETTLNAILKNADSAGAKSKVDKRKYSTTVELEDKKLPEPLLLEINERGDTIRASYKEKPKLGMKTKIRNILRDSNINDIESPNAYLRIEDEMFRDYMIKVLNGLKRNHMTTIWGGGD